MMQNREREELEREELEQLARQRQPAVEDVLGYCWEMVARAIRWRMLDPAILQEVVDHLRRGQSYGSNEIMLEPWGEQMQVSLFDEIDHCPFEIMLDELQRLVDVYTRQETAAIDAKIFNVFTGWFNSDLVDVDNPQEVEDAASACAADLVRNLPDRQATITRLTEMLDDWTPALVLRFIQHTQVEWLEDETSEQTLKRVLELVIADLQYYDTHPPLV